MSAQGFYEALDTYLSATWWRKFFPPFVPGVLGVLGIPGVLGVAMHRPLHFPRPAFTLHPFTLWQPVLFPKKDLGKSISATTKSLVILGI
jgi:hypothetical protein